MNGLSSVLINLHDPKCPLPDAMTQLEQIVSSSALYRRRMLSDWTSLRHRNAYR